VPKPEQPAVPPSGEAPGEPPAPLKAAAGLVLVEGICAVLFGIAEAFSTDADRVALGVTTALFFVAYGVALGGCAWGLWRMRAWSRSPAVLAQLIFLGLAWNLRSGSALPVAIFGAIVAVLVLAGVLHPRSIDALTSGERRD
jgi:uncharacterized membrane protein (DUF2068 family)